MTIIPKINLTTLGATTSVRLLEAMNQPSSAVVGKFKPSEVVNLLKLGVHPGAKGTNVKPSDFSHII